MPISFDPIDSVPDPGDFPFDVAVTDVNGDGIPDLVAAARFGGSADVLLGDGTGGFGAPTSYPVTGTPLAITATDLNGDGASDLVVGTIEGDLDVLLSNGSGGFEPDTTIALGNEDISVVAADVNGDGKPDVVATTSDGLMPGNVDVLLNNGSGGLEAPIAYPAGTDPNDVVVADVNGDGKPDLIVAAGGSSGLNGVSVLLNNGNGTFGPATSNLSEPTNEGSAVSVAVGDVNGDGIPDIVVVNGGTNDLDVLLGKGDGTFGAPTSFSLGGQVNPYRVGLVDIDGDGHLDAVVSETTTAGAIAVLRGDGAGGFSAPVDFATASGSRGFTIADVNGDGKPDILVADGNDNSIGVLLNTSSPCYCPGTLILTATGEMPVETLAIGNTVATASGEHRQIKWIGRRSYAGRFLAANPNVQPIRFRAGCLDDRLPRRDLLVSPEHAMFLDGLLIPARCLVNGSTIVQERGLERVDYFHVELDAHDILLAEGAPSESYLDDDSRSMFHNASGFAALYPDAPALGRFCAPKVDDGYELEAIRRRLAVVAGEIGRAA